jgi:hypothetical protein
MYGTKIGQRILASTNRLQLRDFSCEFFGLLSRIVLYKHTYIHPFGLGNEQYIITREQID